MKEFIRLVNDVFTIDFKVKNCGRDKCIELIKMCKKLDSGKDFGNENTGFMNVDSIRELIDLMKELEVFS